MRFAVVALAAVLSCAGQTVTPENQRADLLERIEDLQRRIPKDLRRPLSLIAMKFATGHCSPYRVLEFEKKLEALDEGKQRKFEKEWEHLQEHPLWPSAEDVEGADDSSK